MFKNTIKHKVKARWTKSRSKSRTTSTLKIILNNSRHLNSRRTESRKVIWVRHSVWKKATDI